MQNQDLTGIFITFEGGEGAGKSTHIKLLAQRLESAGREVLCLREPGGTAIGEQLREILLDPENDAMSERAELLIFEAARAQIIDQVIRPALARGAVVLCDRFYDSTVAYQAYGRGLDRSFVDAANGFAVDGIHPDRTILLVTGGAAQVGLDRAATTGAADRMELAGLDFHQRVNEGFLSLAQQQPERVRLVQSAASIEETAGLVWSQIEDLFPQIAKQDA